MLVKQHLPIFLICVNKLYYYVQIYINLVLLSKTTDTK